VKSAAKIDLNWDQNELNVFLKKKTKYGFLDYATILAHVLMEIPLGRPIFGSKIPDDLIKSIKKTIRSAEKLKLPLGQLGQWLHSGILEGRPRGRPVDKQTAIICFWALLAKRKGKVPWAMLVRLLRWFYKQFKIMNYDYASKIYIRNDEANKKDGRQKFYWGKQFKHLCMIKNKITKSGKNKITKSERAKLDKLLSDPKIMDAFLAWQDRRRESDGKSDWKDKNIETIVIYPKAFIFKATRIFSARSVNFAGGSIEVEAGYQSGGELRPLRMKRNFNNNEFTELLLAPSDRSVLGTVTFS